MSVAVVLQLFALVAVASANASEWVSATSGVSIKPTLSSFSEHYSSPYNYVTYYSHHKEYIYTYETCSAPPSSIEICLSSIFSSLEADLTLIAGSLKIHEASLKVQMHHEHTLLYSEVSWVSMVDYIAKEVREIVISDYSLVYSQYYALLEEREIIYEAYEAVMVQIDELLAEVKDIEEQREVIYEYYKSVEVAKWSIYSAISAIIYEKAAVVEEEELIEKVVASLHFQVEKIYEKIEQLYKRGEWLESWEVQLYNDLSKFQLEIYQFKSVEIDLEVREKKLYSEQEYLLIQIENVQQALKKLHAEYVSIEEELRYVEAYYYELISIRYSVAIAASVFTNAYEEFTCEDSLLYYEACSSPSSVAVVSSSSSSSSKV